MVAVWGIKGPDRSSVVSVHTEGDATFGAVRVRTRAAAVLADLWTLRTDLRIVRANCVRLRTEDFDTQLTHALWEAAVIAYGRCFRDGAPGIKTRARQARLKIPKEMVEALTVGQQATHDKMLMERDKYVGHRVASNGLHEVWVQGLTSDLDGTGDLCGVHVEEYRFVTPGAPQATLAVQQLAEALIQGLDVRISEGYDAVIQELREDESWRPAKGEALPAENPGSGS